MLSKLILAPAKSFFFRSRPSLRLGKRLFCSAGTPNLIPVGEPIINKSPDAFSEQQLTMKDGRKIDLKFNDHSVCYELPERIGGATYDTNGQYMIMFTCKKCDTKSSKFFTKNAYHQGIVLVRCDGCQVFHLIADNLDWFGDGKTNIEKIMKEKNEEMIIGDADPELLRILKMDIEKTRAKLDEAQKVRVAQEDQVNGGESGSNQNDQKL